MVLENKIHNYYSDIQFYSYTQDNITILIEKPENFIQGSSLVINLTTNHTLINPVIKFSNNTSKLYTLSNKTFRGVIGTDPFTNTGNYELHLLDDSSTLNFITSIILKQANYPIHNISEVAFNTRNNYLAKTKEESRRIQELRNTISDLLYWAKRPFTKPAEGEIISDYGKIKYYDGKPLDEFHVGQDIKAPEGTPIFAIAPGKVLLAENLERRGGTVIIDHGQGIVSNYLHMSKIITSADDIVSEGDKIGEIGATGHTLLGSILHWAIYVNGICVNPNEWINLK